MEMPKELHSCPVCCADREEIILRQHALIKQQEELLRMSALFQSATAPDHVIGGGGLFLNELQEPRFIVGDSPLYWDNATDTGVDADADAENTILSEGTLAPCQLWVNRLYSNNNNNCSHSEFYAAMVHLFNGIIKHGRKVSISGRHKSSPSIVIKGIIYIQRPSCFHTDTWPLTHGVFTNEKTLNAYIQKYKFFISQFYHFVCSGRIVDGRCLFGHPVYIISEDALSRQFNFRFLLNQWRGILCYDT